MTASCDLRLAVRVQPFPVYVVHARALRERRVALESVLSALGWSATWVEQADPRDLGVLHWFRRVRNWRLTRAEVSLYEKQILAWRAVDASGVPALVLEDDAVLGPACAAAFERSVAALPASWDLVFFGASCGQEAAAPPPFARAYATRSLSGYLIQPAAAGRLAAVLAANPISEPVDLAVNRLIGPLGLSCWWSVPSLIPNGSETGVVARSLAGGRWRRAVRVWRRFLA